MKKLSLILVNWYSKQNILIIQRNLSWNNKHSSSQNSSSIEFFEIRLMNLSNKFLCVHWSTYISQKRKLSRNYSGHHLRSNRCEYIQRRLFISEENLSKNMFHHLSFNEQPRITEQHPSSSDHPMEVWNDEIGKRIRLHFQMKNIFFTLVDETSKFTGWRKSHHTDSIKGADFFSIERDILMFYTHEEMLNTVLS